MFKVSETTKINMLAFGLLFGVYVMLVRAMLREPAPWLAKYINSDSDAAKAFGYVLAFVVASVVMIFIGFVFAGRRRWWY